MVISLKFIGNFSRPTKYMHQVPGISLPLWLWTRSSLIISHICCPVFLIIHCFCSVSLQDMARTYQWWMTGDHPWGRGLILHGMGKGIQGPRPLVPSHRICWTVGDPHWGQAQPLPRIIDPRLLCCIGFLLTLLQVCMLCGFVVNLDPPVDFSL